MDSLDIASNRATAKYRLGEQVLRVCWSLGALLIRFSPRPMFGWRRFVLRLFGCQVGREVRIYSSTRIVMPWNVSIGDWSALGEDVLIYSLGKVSIGAKSTISYRAHVCAGTHDLNEPSLPLLKPPVSIGAGVWIGTDAFVGPGISIADGAVIGARAVVVSDVAGHSIVAGNPARVIGTRAIRSAPLEGAPLKQDGAGR